MDTYEGVKKAFPRRVMHTLTSEKGWRISKNVSLLEAT